MNMKPTAAIYARYSSNLQDQTSIDDQLSLLRRVALQQGWEVKEIYADYEQSGQVKDRPEMTRMMKDARAKSFDIILIENVNRFGRRNVGNLQGHEILSCSGVKLFSANEGEQDLFKMLMNSLDAQMFSDKIAEATWRGHAGNLENRNRLHGVPYGYRKIDTEKGLNREIDPEQAAIVRRIFSEAAQGKSGDAIARDLNADGIPSPRGQKWHASTIRGGSKLGNGILRKTIYIGQPSYGRTTVKRGPDGSQHRLPGDKSRMVVADIPQLRIIDQDVWDKVSAQFEESAKKTAGRNAGAAHRKKYLLSGLLTCDCCGQPFVIQNSHSGTYTCRGSRNGSCKNKKDDPP